MRPTLPLIFFVAFAALLTTDDIAQPRNNVTANRPQKADPAGTPESLTSVPQPVLKTAETEAGNGRVLGAERNVEDGQPVYEVAIRRRMIRRILTIAPDGTLLSREVFITELPPPVKQTIAKFESTGRVGGIYLSFTDNEESYVVEVHQSGVKRLMTVALDGTHEDTEVSLAELPPALQKSIRDQAGAGEVFTIDRSEIDDGQIFTALMIKDGKRRRISFDIDGAVAGQQVYLSELSPACQNALKKQAGDAKIGYIERSVEEGQTIFDVTIFGSKGKEQFVLGDDGKLLSTVIALAAAPQAVQDALRAQAGAGRIQRVDKLVDEPGYEAEIRTDGKKRTVSVSVDGKVD